MSVSPDTLKQSGQVALEQGLVQLPQFSVATAGTGPFIGGSGQQNVNLRNLGPQRNLVLLDGRRLLPSASDGTVDLQPAAPGHHRQCRDHHRRRLRGLWFGCGIRCGEFEDQGAYAGLEIATAYGTTQSFGGSQFDINAVGGLETDDNRGNIMFAVEYTRRAKVNYASIPFLNQFQNYPVPLVNGEFVPGSNQFHRM